MKAEALACTLWTIRFGRGCGAVVKTQQAVNEQLCYMALINFHQTVNAFAHMDNLGLQFRWFIVPLLQPPKSEDCA
jgi:hypothetical protein